MVDELYEVVSKIAMSCEVGSRLTVAGSSSSNMLRDNGCESS